ncbi:MAG TPA: TIR domain-containing protein [Caulobacteraceae bacterium]|nr:TIR domain-containing protein [Caulobacteraceae bacterium]
MSDVFISYARSTEAAARVVAEALRALGYAVWRDDELPAHRSYAEVIAERLGAAKAVLVIWSADAAKSEWVQSEADRARLDRKLIQLTVDGAPLPMPFDRIQCADLRDWNGEPEAAGWRKVVASVAELVAGPLASAADAPVANRLSVCVLPFANLSGDAEQDYFSDGVTEDIITDLARVSALSVVSRNTAFTFKGRPATAAQVARELGVSHILQGSVRRAGGRVRVTAQLIDGAGDSHVWAERYDRDLTDIFALQDEISEAIVAALRLKLLPQEKRAIERRGTESPEAYDLFLLARERFHSGNDDPRVLDAIVATCGQAVRIDPGYALAWTLMGRAQARLRFFYDRPDIDSWATLERALALDPELADAHALKAAHYRREGRIPEAEASVETALRLDPENFDANTNAGILHLGQGRAAVAARHFERAAATAETNCAAPAMLITCYAALGDKAGERRAARMTVARAEAALALDRSNGAVMGFGVSGLAALGEAGRCRDWIRRALLIDPDNLIMRYNFACTLCVYFQDMDAALEVLAPYFARAPRSDIDWMKVDPDLATLRQTPRFQALLAATEARMAGEGGPVV